MSRRSLYDVDGIDGPFERGMAAPIARPCPVCARPETVTPGRTTCGRSECQEADARECLERAANSRRRARRRP